MNNHVLLEMHWASKHGRCSSSSKFLLKFSFRPQKKNVNLEMMLEKKKLASKLTMAALTSQRIVTYNRHNQMSVTSYRSGICSR